MWKEPTHSSQLQIQQIIPSLADNESIVGDCMRGQCHEETVEVQPELLVQECVALRPAAVLEKDLRANGSSNWKVLELVCYSAQGPRQELAIGRTVTAVGYLANRSLGGQSLVKKLQVTRFFWTQFFN